MKRMLCLFLTLILAVGICFSAPVTITASAADDITVTINTGLSVTLKDADRDGYYDIGTADELYAFATAVNGGKKTINVELTADITINENVLTADGELNGDGSNFRVWTPIGYYNNQDDKSRYSGTFHGNDKTISGLYFNNSNVLCVGLFGTVDYGGKIENVSVIDSYTSGKSNVGGVVGSNGGTVTNCYNKGTVSGSSSVGGVVGSSNGGTVTNCYNEGTVSGTGERVGGVVGENSRTVEDCYNKGTVSGSSSVGGVVGENSRTVEDCYNEGTVSGTGGRVGGVVGYNFGTVTNCYNEGVVSGTGSYVGGVVGSSDGTVTNCYNKGAVSGNYGVGGVVGYSYGPVKNCYNEGTVSGTGESVGGVVGSSNGTVTNCYNKGNISGSSYVGGVVGNNKGAVTNCYNEGTVSGTGESVGGVVGYNYMTCKNCYYLSDCATDGNNVTQFGIGNITLGSTTADVSGQTDSKTADWFTSGEVCATVGYHQGADAANGFCNLCTYDPATLNEDEYYEISNAGQLFWFANYINTKDRTANAVLTADIDLENRLWTPIGKTDEDNNNFRGHFDGQNHTIKGLYIERSSKGIGFFGEVRTGIVENFTIYGEVNVKGECDYVGGVIGSICGLNGENDLERNGAIIRNITSYVNLTASAHGIGRIGGFVGYANHETLIENCSWYGTFDAGSYRVDTGAGGFIGNVHEDSNVTIRNCAAYGTIKTNYKKNSYDSQDNIYMGGFLSYSESDANTVLENCLFAGKFEKGENLTDKALLGAFGTLKSVKSIVNCYYLGDDGLEAVHSDSTLNPNSPNIEITSITKAQLLSGEVAYKLQGEENTHFWGQTIDTDDYPVLGGDKVYYGYISCADDAKMVYTNNENAVTEKPKHTGGTASCKEKAVCENCGDSYGDFAPHTYENGKCTAEGCGYACAHETPDENGICTDCYFAEGTCGENITWIYDSKTTTLTISGSGAMADYEGDNKPWNSFKSQITNVIINNGVTTIGNYAFGECSNLKSITIPETVTTIGQYAFYGCTKLTSVTIPDSVTFIGESAFECCSSLEAITIPKGVESVGIYTFRNCTNLKTVVLPESVQYIYVSAFGGCTSLKKMVVPHTVKEIKNDDVWQSAELTFYVELGSYAHTYAENKNIKCVFSGYTEAETAQIEKLTFTLNADSESYSVTARDKTISGSLTIPSTYNGKHVTKIGYSAFVNCESLTSVVIPDSVVSLGEMAFYSCDSLETVTLSSNITVIPDEAFAYCESLKTLPITENVASIGECAFYASGNFGSVSLSNVTIGSSAFFQCGITELTLEKCKLNDASVFINNNIEKLTISETDIPDEMFDGNSYIKTLVAENSVLGSKAFSNCMILENVTVSGGEIANYAFQSSYSLEKLTIKNIVSVGEFAFNDCGLLETIEVDATKISEGAFAQCDSLKNVKLGDELEVIEKNAFEECRELTEIVIPESVTTIGANAFDSCTLLETAIIGNGVKFIGDSAFEYCEKLETVTIGKNVTTIGAYAFSSCSSLKEIAIPESVTTIGESAFSGCENVTLKTELGSIVHTYAKDNNIKCVFNGYTEAESAQIYKLTFALNDDGESYSVTRCDTQISGGLEIPATYKGKPITAIGVEAFYNCDALTSVTIPESVTTIGEFAFDSCESLTSVTIGEGVTTIGKYAFSYCTELTSVTIPDSVTTIGKYAFAECSSLTSVTIGEGVTTIGDFAFQNCESLTKIDLNNVEIGNNAFDGCKSVTEVNLDNCTIGIDTFLDLSSLETLTCKNTDIPNYAFHTNKSLKTVTISGGEIGEGAFAECDALSSLNISGVETIGEHAFYKCIALVKIDLSDVEIGDNAFDGCKSVTEINLDNCTIGISTFLGLSSLETLTCKDTDIPDYAFYMNTSLKTVTISGGEIGEGAFGICDTLKEISIANDVIGKLAFYSCKHLETIDVDTAKISESAFALCDSLKNVKLGDELGVIEKYAFAKCRELTEIVIPASVTSIDGYAFYDCSELKYIFFEGTETIGDALVTNAKIHYGSSTHTFNENYTVDVEPTCTEKGSKSQHCKYCDLTQNVTIIDELGHTPVKGGTESAHTICDVCKEPLSTTHNLTSKITTAPTCTEEGVETFTCECGYTYTKPVAAKGHDIVTDKAVAPTCTKTGLTEGSHCTRCDDKTVKQNVIPTKAHTEVTVTGKAATCTATGLTDGKKCSVCGTTTVAQQTIAKKGHTEVTVTGKAATCTDTGLTDGKKCSVCGKTTVEQQIISAKGHDIVTDKAVAATCTKTGLTEGSHCSRCSGATVKQEVVPATGHTTSVINKKDATCTAEGYTGDTQCTVCKTVTAKGTAVAKLAHKTTVVGAKPATAKEAGYTGDTKCTVCGTVTQKGTTIAKLTLAAPKVTQKNTAKGISLTWGKVTNAESYRVYRRTYNTKTKKYSEWTTLSKAQKGTSFVDTKVKLGTTYSYMVKAINSGVLSKGTPTKNLKYNVTPTVTVANASKGISVSWSPIANATGYEVYSSTYNAKTKKWSSFTKRATAKENAKSWTDTKAKSGTKYKYTVKALNGKVASAYNKSGVQIVRLAQPTTKIVNASNGIKVSWGKVSGATSYEILRADYNAKTKKWNKAKKVATAKSSATSWTDTKVKSGVQYRYTVKAVNGKVYSSYKTTSGLMFLTMPKTTVKAVKTGITVTWTQSTGATSYEVYRAEYNKKTKKYTAFKKVATAKSTAKKWTDTKAKKGVKYKYTVKAVNGKVASAYKAVVVSR